MHGVQDILREVLEVLLVLLRENYVLYSGPMGREKFFLYTSDWEHLPSQRNFTGHGHIIADGDPGQGGNDGSGQGYSCGWPVLGNRALRDVDVKIHLAVKIATDAVNCGAASDI